MITSVFPSSFGFSAIEGDDWRQVNIAPAESDYISSSASPKAREQFLRGRAAAHMSLRQIGRDCSAIGRGERGRPLWPTGVVGSISHSADTAIAATALVTEVRGIGIDLESLMPLRAANILSRIALPSEAQWVSSDAELFQQRLVLLFSAKESIYKALYPLTNTFFGFHDAELVWNEVTMSMTGVLLKNLSGEFPAGYSVNVDCVVEPKFVFTAVVIK